MSEEERREAYIKDVCDKLAKGIRAGRRISLVDTNIYVRLCKDVKELLGLMVVTEKFHGDMKMNINPFECAEKLVVELEAKGWNVRIRCESCLYCVEVDDRTILKGKRLHCINEYKLAETCEAYTEKPKK